MMKEDDFMFLLYLADTPLFVKEAIEEILVEERECKKATEVKEDQGEGK